MSTEMPSNHLILCHPLFLLPSIFPSIRVFSNESTLRMRWPKYWSFSFSISLSNEHPGLISFRINWLDHVFLVAGRRRGLRGCRNFHRTRRSFRHDGGPGHVERGGFFLEINL